MTSISGLQPGIGEKLGTEDRHVAGRLTSPSVLLLADVLALLQISRRTCERLRRSGRFPIAELQPRLGRRPRFARAAVEAYATGRKGRAA